jgi:hypothetical protein
MTVDNTLKWLIVAILLAFVGLVLASYVCFPVGGVDLDERYF